jgi:hypothetical protein
LAFRGEFLLIVEFKKLLRELGSLSDVCSLWVSGSTLFLGFAFGEN